MPHTPSTPSSAPEPGTQIAGKYRVERTLATGGMGVVVLVRHEVLGQKAVIKLLLPAVAASPGASERFLREARAAANLRSEHVARVFDVGALEDGTPYMLMEYLDGNDLATELEQRGRLPAAEAVDYALEALEAIAEAHAIGVVHRDLKPSNLFLVTKPGGGRMVKVLDFGISKVTSELGRTDDAVTTAENALLGSPAYMSPEQVRSSKDVDGRTDVWSLGVVLYELITGRRAFDAPNMGAILSQILTDDVPPLTRVLPGSDPDLEHVIQRCLARDRDARYPGAETLREVLMPFGSGSARVTRPPPSQETVVARTGDRSASGTQTTVAVSSERVVTPPASGVSAAAPPRKSRVVPVMLGAVSVILAGVWIFGRGGPPASTTVDPKAQGVVTDVVVTPGTVAPTAAASPSATATASASASATSEPSAAPIVLPSSAPSASVSARPAKPLPPRVAPARDTPSIDLNQRN